jgi:hypothetical protein
MIPNPDLSPHERITVFCFGFGRFIGRGWVNFILVYKADQHLVVFIVVPDSTLLLKIIFMLNLSDFISLN